MGKCSRVGFTFRVSQTQTRYLRPRQRCLATVGKTSHANIQRSAIIKRYTNAKGKFKVPRRNANTEYKYEIQFLSTNTEYEYEIQTKIATNQGQPRASLHLISKKVVFRKMQKKCQYKVHIPMQWKLM